MSDPVKSKEASSNGHQTKTEDQKPTFWEWLVYGKGTVSEPWPTADEVLADPNLQKEIQGLKNSFKRYKTATEQCQNKNKKVVISIKIS